MYWCVVFVYFKCAQKIYVVNKEVHQIYIYFVCSVCFTHVSPVITNFAYFIVYSRWINTMTCSLAKLYGRCLCIDCLCYLYRTLYKHELDLFRLNALICNQVISNVKTKIELSVSIYLK